MEGVQSSLLAAKSTKWHINRLQSVCRRFRFNRFVEMVLTSPPEFCVECLVVLSRSRATRESLL